MRHGATRTKARNAAPTGVASQAAGSFSGLAGYCKQASPACHAAGGAVETNGRIGGDAPRATLRAFVPPSLNSLSLSQGSTVAASLTWSCRAARCSHSGGDLRTTPFMGARRRSLPDRVSPGCFFVTSYVPTAHARRRCGRSKARDAWGGGALPRHAVHPPAPTKTSRVGRQPSGEQPACSSPGAGGCRRQFLRFAGSGAGPRMDDTDVNRRPHLPTKGRRHEGSWKVECRMLKGEV